MCEGQKGPNKSTARTHVPMRLNTSRLMPAGFFFLLPPTLAPTDAPEEAAAGLLSISSASPSETVGRAARPKMSATSPMAGWCGGLRGVCGRLSPTPACCACCWLGGRVTAAAPSRVHACASGLMVDQGWCEVVSELAGCVGEEWWREAGGRSGMKKSRGRCREGEEGGTAVTSCATEKAMGR